MKNLFLVLLATASFSAFSADKSCFNVSGMSCDACEKKIKEAVTKIDGVSTLNVSSKDGKAQVEFDSKKTNDAALIKAIRESGFEAAKSTCS
jgi:copper ion binding protein